MNENNTAEPLTHDEPEKHECAKCVALRKLLKQKHGECWPCAKKRHNRDWKRNQGRKALAAKQSAPKERQVDKDCEALELYSKS